MISYAGIARNLRFMLVQVKKQLENTHKLLTQPDPRYVKAIRGSEGYIDTQKSMIENECFAFIRRTGEQDEEIIASVRAVAVITSNLERIADFTVNITRQMEHLSDPHALAPYDGPAYISHMLSGIELIEPALFERDSSLALRVCRIEDEIDRLYHADLHRAITALRDTRDVEDIVTALFIVHYLERMGDALLNIGEAILFAVLGEKLKVHQYQALDDALAATPMIEQPLRNVELDSIWGTRSGVRIGKMEQPDASGTDRRVLFKEGNPEKLERERQALERWEQVAPGLVPAVVEYQHAEKGAALLLQYIDGRTLQDIVLNGADDLVRKALQRLTDTLADLWSATRKDAPASGHFVRQLVDRLDDVYRLHPELKSREVHVGPLRVPSFNERLSEAADFDAELAAPFSVFIHGDFNLDNVIYNLETESVHFVDVQRSRDMDYVQDVSVFLVSNFRLPVLSGAGRRRLVKVALAFLDFARRFAVQNDDRTFEARLALGMVRSFATSTRFELNRRFARSMHQRAVLLLSRLLEHRAAGKPWDAFRVPDTVLVY